MSDKDAAHLSWISHRGLKEGAEENTFEAFSEAVEAGFTTLETDLRLSKDGQIVLIHDATLTRLAGDSRRVAELTRAELEKIRLRGGGRLLFLDRFVTDFRSSDWSFDIKPEHGEQLVPALAALLERSYPGEASELTIRFCTWRRNHEQMLMQFFPQATCYARKGECWRAGLSVLSGAPACGGIRGGRTYAIPPRFGSMSLFRKSLVKQYHQRGARTIAFLPRTDSENQAALLAGFDEILTDGRILET